MHVKQNREDFLSYNLINLNRFFHRRYILICSVLDKKIKEKKEKLLFKKSFNIFLDKLLFI